MMKIATKIDDINGWTGHATLYRLSPPMRYRRYKEEQITEQEYVIVSAITMPKLGPETYIFASNSTGHVMDWCELEGSQHGTLRHSDALGDAGYSIAEHE